MRRRHWFVIILLPLFLVTADTAYWWVTADRLRRGIEDWISAQRARGWTIDAEPVLIGGWPWSAEAAMRDFAIRHAAGGLPGNLSWKTAAITLSVQLFRPTAMIMALGGPQRVSIGGSPESIMTFDEMTVAVPLLAAPGRSADLHAKALRLAPVNGAWRSSVGVLDGHAALNGYARSADSADATPEAVLFTANADAIDLPPVTRWPLGPHIASVVLSGKLNGPLPAFHNAAEWATAWRDGGGSLEVSHLAVGWGPLNVTTSATLALDDQLQPMGSGSAHLVGYAETLDRLSAAGMLTRSAATVAKAILSLMAGTGDSPSAVDVPLTLQYRTLSMRQVPLTRLPELDWPTR